MAAKLLDMVVQAAEVRAPADIERAQIARLARIRGLPFMGINEQYVEAGALMSYGVDAIAIARRVPVNGAFDAQMAQ